VVSEKGYSSYPDAYSKVQYAYDYVGNVIGITDANGNLNSSGYTQSNTYDKLNRLTSTKNANDEIIRNTYDNAGNITKQTLTDSKGAESILYQRNYDGEGKLISDTDNAGNSNRYQYNDLGQLVRYWDKDNKFFSATYNELGVQDTANKVIEEGTITSRHYSHQNPYGANAVYDIRGEYVETGGNYQVHLNEIGVYDYSPTGKLLGQKELYTQSTGANGVYFEPYMDYSYDTNGNILSAKSGLCDETIKVFFGFTANYEYDKNRLTKVQIDGNSARDTSDSVNVRYEYYADGKLKSVTYPALTDNSILKSEYIYDGLSRLTSLTNYKGTDILSSYTYTYDNNGNILTTNETVGTIQHNTAYTYDKLNRIASVAGTKGVDSYYEYDARGNRKANFEQIDFLSEEDAIFQYNEEDKLIYSGVGDDTTRFLYSANGYRYWKMENTDYPEFYVYDSNGRLNIVAKLVTFILPDNSTIPIMYPITQYVWGPDRVLAKIEPLTDKSYYYLYNGHGDVVQIVDTSGAIKNTYDYDVWGNFITKQEAIDNHFTYFGQTYDETTGLYYLRARYYDPTTGRFTQQDPAEDGYNWYVYGNQNPVMFVDESGLYYLETDANGQVYAIIESGDTLSEIAKAEVNDATAYTKMTMVSNFNSLYVGQRINITPIYNSKYPKPQLSASTNGGDSTANNRRPSTGEPGSTHTTPKGDARIYGPDGNPDTDIDQPHGHNPNPHMHRWNNGNRGPAEPIPEGFTWAIVGGFATLINIAAYFYGYSW
jgi:RHS repeat-associated protein